jgi:hypothetical protein
MLRHVTTSHRAALAAAILVLLALTTGCGSLPFLGGSPAGAAPQIESGVTDMGGFARVESAAGAMDFQVTSALTGERLPGARLSVAVQGSTTMLLATDPTGVHLPLAVPLTGEATVRRLILPAKTPIGYNIATAAGPLDLEQLTLIGTLSEEEIQNRLRGGPDEAVLIYLYNPARPLALTGAALEAYATPFDNVTVLKAGGEPPDATLGLIVVGLDRSVYATWSNRVIDRYLAGRVGQAPDVDLRGDLDFAWAYPVYDVYPPDETIDLGTDSSATLLVNWRSHNPDPPPPWSFFVSAEQDWITVEPQAFGLGPDQTQSEITLQVNREGLPVGEYSVKVFIQPFSETFGLIEQPVEREIMFTVAEIPPTPTQGPTVGLSLSPTQPREGDMLIVEAGGFDPGEVVTLEFSGEERSINDLLPRADDGGNFRYEIDLGTVPAGSYTLRLAGETSGITAEQNVTVAEGVADAVVASDELNLRRGPTYEHSVLEVLVRGDELTVIGTNADDSWIEVQTATGQTGWVVTNLVNLNIDLATVPWNPNVVAPP